jgi:hypothetical protein
MLFEDLPSDDESLSLVDDIDVNETYIPEPNNHTLFITESDSEIDEHVYILILYRRKCYLYSSKLVKKSFVKSSKKSK